MFVVYKILKNLFEAESKIDFKFTPIIVNDVFQDVSYIVVSFIHKKMVLLVVNI